MFGHGETVRQFRYSTVTDAHGNSRRVLDEEVDLPNVGVGPNTSTDDLADGDRVNTGITLHLPFSAPVSSSDRFDVRGQLYEVEGIPLGFRNPFTGWSPGATVSLRRVTG